MSDEEKSQLRQTGVVPFAGKVDKLKLACVAVYTFLGAVVPSNILSWAKIQHMKEENTVILNELEDRLIKTLTPEREEVFDELQHSILLAEPEKYKSHHTSIKDVVDYTVKSIEGTCDSTELLQEAEDKLRVSIDDINETEAALRQLELLSHSYAGCDLIGDFLDNVYDNERYIEYSPNIIQLVQDYKEEAEKILPEESLAKGSLDMEAAETAISELNNKYIELLNKEISLTKGNIVDKAIELAMNEHTAQIETAATELQQIIDNELAAIEPALNEEIELIKNVAEETKQNYKARCGQVKEEYLSQIGGGWGGMTSEEIDERINSAISEYNRLIDLEVETQIKYAKEEAKKNKKYFVKKGPQEVDELNYRIRETIKGKLTTEMEESFERF